MATPKLTTRRRIGVVAIAVIALSTGACTALDDTLAKVPFFSFMREAPFFDPYEMPRPAPENSVPYKSPLGATALPRVPANVRGPEFEFWAALENPVPMTEEVLAAGRVLYDRHCMVCHGTSGEGNGPVVQPGTRFPTGPSLLLPVMQNYPDGYIYGVIREGRSLMPAYGGRINHQERWYIVNYVRLLQQQAQGGATQPAATGSGED